MMAVERDSSSRGRGDCGFTTLEWLLLVAAVAGLAALAVVLVVARVEGTAERVSSPDPRVTTAIHAAFEVQTDARSATGADFAQWADWERHFSQQCSLLAVLYADAEVEVVHNNFNRATGGGTAFDAIAAAAADEQAAGHAKAQVQCEVA